MIAKSGIAAPRVRVFFSTLQDQDFLFSPQHSLADLEKNWQQFLRQKKISASRMLFMEQTHGNGVAVAHANAEMPLASVDAVVSNIPGVFLAVKSADCLPVLLFNATGTVMAAVHAGWRGTAARVVEATLQCIEETFSVPASDLFAVLGPCICASCYNVATALDDRVAQFETQFGAHTVLRSKNHVGLDLRAANVFLLHRAGVHRNRILHIDDCTAHGVLHLPSHYQNQSPERFISTIGVSNE